MAQPYCIGLTGGIGCGKSTAAGMLAALGAAVIDTDEISRELTASGGAAMPAIEQTFGKDYLDPDGALERAKMRERVFRDPAEKRRLEDILHPLIREETRLRIARARAPYVVLVVPLLLETGAYKDLVQRVLVVDCDEAEQVSRTEARSGLTPEQVRAIMANQLPRTQRLAAADDVLRNDGGFEKLRHDVEALHARYLGLAARFSEGGERLGRSP